MIQPSVKTSVETQSLFVKIDFGLPVGSEHATLGPTGAQFIPLGLQIENYQKNNINNIKNIQNLWKICFCDLWQLEPLSLTDF